MVEIRPGIMVVGSSNTDMVIKTERLPKPGETVVGGEFMMVSGGKGANQAVAAARLGADVRFVARVGSDVFGDASIESFRSFGIRTDYIARDRESPSGTALIFVDANGENVIVVAPGANARLSPADVDRAADVLSECAVLLLQLETPPETVLHAARLARKAGVKVILTPAPAPANPLSTELLGNVDILVPNETEAAVLLGLEPGARVDDVSVARGILDLGVGTVVITLGSKGALIVTPDGSELVPAVSVTPVDTVAAGDAFTGALSYSLACGRGIREAVGMANMAAAISVTRMGAQSSMPTVSEVEELAVRLGGGA